MEVPRGSEVVSSPRGLEALKSGGKSYVKYIYPLPAAAASPTPSTARTSATLAAARSTQPRSHIYNVSLSLSDSRPIAAVSNVEYVGATDRCLLSTKKQKVAESRRPTLSQDSKCHTRMERGVHLRHRPVATHVAIADQVTCNREVQAAVTNFDTSLCGSHAGRAGFSATGEGL